MYNKKPKIINNSPRGHKKTVLHRSKVKVRAHLRL